MKPYKLNTGALMPSIGFGTWQIIFHAKQKVTKAIDAGYRLIDTARIYGNEVGVGAAVRDCIVPREELFVTTKLWNSDQGYASAHRAIDESLSRLGLDYVDLYLVHWPGHDSVRRQDSWRALEEIYKSGKARAIGVSNFAVEHLEELFEYASVKPAVNQIEFHPFVYKDQKPILEFCNKAGIVVEAYSPLAHGRHQNEPILKEIAQAYGVTTAQVMLAWCMTHRTIPIPKTTDDARMKQNLAAVDIKLSDKDVKRINNLSNGKSVL